MLCCQMISNYFEEEALENIYFKDIIINEFNELVDNNGVCRAGPGFAQVF